MKEIRRERVIPSYTVEEVTFIADDGTEFKVEGNIDEASARKKCERYNKSLDEAKIQKAFGKLNVVWLEGLNGNPDIGHWIGVVHNDDEWEVLCLYMHQEFCDASGVDVDKDQPASYPAGFAIGVDGDYCWTRRTMDEEKTERNADGKITNYVYRPLSLQELLDQHNAAVAEIEKQIARLDVER
jgi:hypothetical protein